MGELTAQTKGILASELSNFRAKAQEFLRAQAYLDRAMPDRNKYPAEYARWVELRQYGNKVRDTVQYITSMIDTAGNVAGSVWYGITHPFGIDIGLGILPVIPAAGAVISGAVIASSIAAMTYFITNAYTFAKYADASPEERAQLLAFEKAQSSGGFAAMLTSVKGIMIIGAIIFIAPKIFDAMKKR